MSVTLPPPTEETERPAPAKETGASRALVVAFLVFIFAVPLFQMATDLLHRRPPQALEVFRQKPTLENIQAYEKELERESTVMDATRPYMQWLFTRLSGRGNEKVVTGKDGWLFYRPSLNHVFHPGFMGAAAGIPKDAPEGDPLSSILMFRDSLKAHGVDLLLVPVPGKEMIYPEYLVPGYRLTEGPPRNADTDAFQAELDRQGVSIFDPTRILWDAKPMAETPLYLPMDTHWSPGGMSVVAQALAAEVSRRGLGEGAPPVCLQAVRQTVENRGDIYDMLDLPKEKPLFTPTRVTVQQVRDASTGEPYRPVMEAPVLLLGDSFTNVFSDPTLGWGETAGLGEHLALHLGFGVDVIALNDGGVNGSRARLARMPALLEGKRLVIWQFATRDLTDKARAWKRIRLRPPAHRIARTGAEGEGKK